MLKKLVTAIALLLPAPCWAATHTVYFTAATGGTYYAYPENQTLASWSTFRVQLTEQSAPNLGSYTGSLNDANGNVWHVFSGASQPSNWSGSLGQWTLEQKLAPDAISATELAASAFSELLVEWINGGRLDLLLDQLIADVAGIGSGGETQPRVNFPPDPAFTTKVDNRSSGQHKCIPPMVITPGAIDKVYIAIDMSPLFGQKNFVKTVGTPVVSGGSATASAEGPRDWYAFVELDGTATASEVRTVTVPITMTTGTKVNVTFDLKVTAN